MKTNEFLEAIKDMDAGERREFTQSVFADLDGREVFESEIDRAINRAVVSHDEKLKAAGKLADKHDLKKRLNGIEKGYEKKVRQLELESYAKITAVKRGIDYELLDGVPYVDESAIDTRCDAISAAMERQRSENINQILVRDSYKPMSGKSPSNTPSLENLTARQAIQLEQTGELNTLLEK